jgi:hypothetical protein
VFVELFIFLGFVRLFVSVLLVLFAFLVFFTRFVVQLFIFQLDVAFNVSIHTRLFLSDVTQVAHLH